MISEHTQPSMSTGMGELTSGMRQPQSEDDKHETIPRSGMKPVLPTDMGHNIITVLLDLMIPGPDCVRSSKQHSRGGEESSVVSNSYLSTKR
jgi:hypothetical protein